MLCTCEWVRTCAVKFVTLVSADSTIQTRVRVTWVFLHLTPLPLVSIGTVAPEVNEAQGLTTSAVLTQVGYIRTLLQVVVGRVRLTVTKETAMCSANL